MILQFNPPRFLLRRYEIIKNLNGGKTFLEVGAGNLMLSSELVNYFDQGGTAIDLSEKIYDYYESYPDNIKRKLKVENVDFYDIKLESKPDCIISCEVLEHIPNDTVFMAEVFKNLNDNGQYILSVPCRMKLWSNHDLIAGHVRRYEKNEIISKLEGVGFKNIKVISYGIPIIHFFRLLRIFNSFIFSKNVDSMTNEEKTVVSGDNHLPKQLQGLAKLSGIFVNKYTMLPFNWVGKVFNNLDKSDGYVVVCNKR